MVIILKVDHFACTYNNYLCPYIVTTIKVTNFLFLSLIPSVQEDAEPGVVPFVRDESLRESGVRIHLHNLSR